MEPTKKHLEFINDKDLAKKSFNNISFGETVLTHKDVEALSDELYATKTEDELQAFYRKVSSLKITRAVYSSLISNFIGKHFNK